MVLKWLGRLNMRCVQIAFVLMCMVPVAVPVHAVGMGLGQEALPEEGKLAIEMAPYDFSLIQRGRLQGKVSLTLTLVVQDQRHAEMIRARLPQIRSDFLGGLTTLSRQRFNVNKPIDPDIVTAFLTPYLSHRVGEGKARVYVKHALIKPSR